MSISTPTQEGTTTTPVERASLTSEKTPRPKTAEAMPLASSKILEIPVQPLKLLQAAKIIVPRLTAKKYKGQYGRVGVIGGSLEYTGAPYFAAMTALKVGADLAHVFCARDAATVIKSYSPELIVHPLLDAENPLDSIEPWLERLHVVVIGPGLGRDPKVQEVAAGVMGLCMAAGKPLIIDADGLNIVRKNLSLVCGRQKVILTPNAIEFTRIFGDDPIIKRERMHCLGSGVLVLEKGANDKLHIPHTGEVYTLPIGGSGRRCGGQGDLLCGALAVFYHWCLEANTSNPAFLASFAATHLVKQCNAAAFKKHGRSMLASDMVNEVAGVFYANFEITDEKK